MRVATNSGLGMVLKNMLLGVLVLLVGVEINVAILIMEYFQSFQLVLMELIGLKKKMNGMIEEILIILLLEILYFLTGKMKLVIKMVQVIMLELLQEQI